MTTEDQPPTFAELRQRIIAGGDVSPEAYERARTLAELDELQQIADTQAAARQAEQERTARFDALRARAQHIVDQRQQRDDLAEQIRQAAADMIRIQDAMEAEQGAVIHALVGEGIRAGQEDHGIGWANANAFTRADHIRLDDLVVSAGNVRAPIELALGAAGADAGKQRGYFGSIVPARPR